jgi:microcystin-dependent protein
MADQYFFKVPFAEAGDVDVIPQASQPSGDVSFTDGFTVDYQLDPDIEPTAKDVPRDQFNYMMNVITNAMQILQIHGFPDFITTAANGGSPYSYAINATVRFTGGWAGAGAMNYYSLADSNTADPTDNTKWGLVTYQQFERAGVVKEYFGASLPTGYVWANGTTLGSAASGATGRANADTLSLYTILWDSYSNTVLPIQTSAGAPSTRGASALADFNLNKRMPVPDRRERVSVGKGDMGGTADPGYLTLAGSGFNPTTLGAAGGVETVALTANQNGTHSHALTVDDNGLHFHPGTTDTSGTHIHNIGEGINQGGGPNVAGRSDTRSTNVLTNSAGAHTHTLNTDNAGTHNHTATAANSGLGTAHINVQPTIVSNFIIALGTA